MQRFHASGLPHIQTRPVTHLHQVQQFVCCTGFPIIVAMLLKSSSCRINEPISVDRGMCSTGDPVVRSQRLQEERPNRLVSAHFHAGAKARSLPTAALVYYPPPPPDRCPANNKVLKKIRSGQECALDTPFGT